MAYKQEHQYGYRDALQKGDPEKVIKGEYFDDEFSAIEGAFEALSGGDSTIDPDDAAFGDVVFQNRTTDQQVVSKFTFAVDGQEPLTVENTGIWAGVNYVKYVSADTTWKILPGLDVEGDLNVSGSTHLSGSLEVDGTTQLNADLNVDGNIGATGNISMDGNLAIGGVIDGDLTVNGNINIDGGSIIAPNGDGHIEDGTQENQIAHWHSGSGKWVGVSNVRVTDSGQMGIGVTGVARSVLHLLDGSPDITFENANGDFGKIGINSIDDTLRTPNNFTSEGDITAVNFIGDGSQLTNLPDGYDGTDAVKLTGNQTIGGAKTFSSNVTAPDFVATSDERVKDNITTAPVGLIDSIRGREWDWKESGEKGSGVVAQELEEVLPHLVRTDDDGMKSVAYNGLLAYLIEELRDCRQRLAVLEALNDN